LTKEHLFYIIDAYRVNNIVILSEAKYTATFLGVTDWSEAGVET
jgi:hypothetical protein